MRLNESGAALPVKERKLLWRNWLRWGVLLMACFFYTWFYTGFLSYTMLYLVALLPAVSLTALVVNLFTFRISETLNERIFVKGEAAMYQLILANESPLPIPYVSISMYLEGQILCRDMRVFTCRCARLQKKPMNTACPCHTGAGTVSVWTALCFGTSWDCFIFGTARLKGRAFW